MLTDHGDLEGEDRVISIADVAARRVQAQRHLYPDAALVVNRLPLYVDPLLDRHDEMETMHQLLARPEVQMLTLIGPGGVGKSRLAIEAARGESASFGHDSWYVDVSRINHMDDLLSGMADAFGLQVAGKVALLESLEQWVGARRILLVLDGYERVTTEGMVLNDFVAACPNLKVLVTSREPLRLRCEHVMTIGPLALPDMKGTPALESVASSPAVALFIARAQAMRLDFRLTDANARDVVAICARLGGIPLAIELAAAQSSYMPPPAILHSLEQRGLVFKDKAQDIPQRHRSAIDTIEWSYGQLSAQDQAFFRRLSVFSGSFTIDAAGEVAAPGAESVDVLNRLSVLTDKSFIVPPVTAVGEPRFRIADMLGQYARAQLSRHSEDSTAQERHARFFLGIAERAARHMQGNEQEMWLTRLDLECENLRSAQRWARESDQSEIELRFTLALSGYWWFRGQVGEGIVKLRGALSRYTGKNERLKAQAMNALGVFFRWIGDYDQAAKVHKDIVRRWKQLHDVSLETLSLMNLGAALFAAGKFREARRPLDEALAAFLSVADSWGAAQTRLYLATLDVAEGRMEEGEAQASQSLSAFEGLGDIRARAVILTVLARTAAAREDISLGVQRLTESMQAIGRLNEHRLICIAVEETAWLASATEHGEEAAELLAAADVLRHQTAFARTAYEQGMYDEALERLRARLDAESVARAFGAGRGIPQDHLIDMSRSLANRLVSPLAAEVMSHGSPARGGLSKREHEVLELVAQGMTNRQIAANLAISENTAKFHITSLLNKLGADSRAQIVALAAHQDMLPE